MALLPRVYFSFLFLFSFGGGVLVKEAREMNGKEKKIFPDLLVLCVILSYLQISNGKPSRPTFPEKLKTFFINSKQALPGS